MKIINQLPKMRKTALITGASSGIGRCMAEIMRKKGFDLIITGRNCRELLALCEKLGRDHVTAVSADLSDASECTALYQFSRRYPVCILINNAGFGVYGEFSEVKLEEEIKMLDVNVRAVHILTKLFLNDFIRRDKGYILNVSSAAAFMPGPFMSGYYAGKSYVLRQVIAIREELRRRGSHVRICALCPGPVDTDFNRRAGVRGSFKGINAEYAALSGINGMFKGRTVIIPGLKMQLVCAAGSILPQEITAAVNYYIQKRKSLGQNAQNTEVL